MHKWYLIVFICLINLSLVFETNGQTKNYLQMDVSAGYTRSMQSFAENINFAGEGYNANVGFDYFFGRLGIGVDGGYFQNNTNKSFGKYINQRFLENITFTNTQSWQTKYLLFGPSLKIGGNTFEFDIFFKAGLGQTNVPTLIFNKTFANQQYPVYNFSGDKDKWYGAWTSGVRLHWKLTHLLGLQMKANYYSNEYLGKINHRHAFRDAEDTNNNGKIDDVEYFESGVVEKNYSAVVHNLNFNAGIILQLGKPKPYEIIQMIPEIVLNDIEPEENKLPKDDMVTIFPEKPVESKNEEKVETNVIQSQSQSELIVAEIEVQNFPDTDYDELAAQFLYKAGQSYFAANDFENSVACFNKLKADAKYPMARYMFSLSMAEMGNCEESFSEYRSFALEYKGVDAGILETVYASHLERCKYPNKAEKQMVHQEKPDTFEKQKSLNSQYESNTKVKSESNTNVQPDTKAVLISRTEDLSKISKEAGKTYRVQFIALKKPSFTFPDLYDIGDITTEYFPSRSMYRYILGPFLDLDDTMAVAQRIRKMGYKDAFVAEYIDGVRTNTLFHSK